MQMPHKRAHNQQYTSCRHCCHDGHFGTFPAGLRGAGRSMRGSRGWRGAGARPWRCRAWARPPARRPAARRRRPRRPRRPHRRPRARAGRPPRPPAAHAAGPSRPPRRPRPASCARSGFSMCAAAAICCGWAWQGVCGRRQRGPPPVGANPAGLLRRLDTNARGRSFVCSRLVAVASCGVQTTQRLQQRSCCGVKVGKR